MKIKFILFERTLEMVKELHLQFFPYRSSFLRYCDFVWYVNNTMHTSHGIMSCWEIMYMIKIILLNQSKLSLLGVIRQILLHAQFRVTLFDNFNDISTFTTTHYLIWRIQCDIYISNKSQYLKTKSDMEKL